MIDWIPACAGMTGLSAGMTGLGAGMTGLGAGMTTFLPVMDTGS